MGTLAVAFVRSKEVFSFDTILADVLQAVQKWKIVDNMLGISPTQQNQFEPAFRLVE